MTDKAAVQLLTDLLVLRKRYGKKAFSDLKQILDDPNWKGSIVEILDELSNVDLKRPTSKPQRKEGSSALTIEEKVKSKVDKCFLDTDARKSVVLAFAENFMKRRILETNEKATRFLYNLSKSESTKGLTRQRILEIMLEELAKMDSDTLKIVVDSAKTQASPQGDLSKWANIIIKNQEN